MYKAGILLNVDFKKKNWLLNFLFVTSSEKPDNKTVKVEEAAQTLSTAEQQHQGSQPEEKHEAAAVESPKDIKKDSRRCLFVCLCVHAENQLKYSFQINK